MSLEDIYTVSGIGIYTAVAYNSGGRGKVSESVSIFVGEDIPKAPHNIKVLDELNAIHLSWDKVSEFGVNGQFVNPDNVKYKIYDIIQEGDGSTQFKDETSSMSYIVERATDKGNQDLLQFGVSAFSNSGESNIKISPAILIGKPYNLPFNESFGNKKFKYDMWLSLIHI